MMSKNAVVRDRRCKGRAIFIDGQKLDVVSRKNLLTGMALGL